MEGASPHVCPAPGRLMPIPCPGGPMLGISRLLFRDLLYQDVPSRVSPALPTPSTMQDTPGASAGSARGRRDSRKTGMFCHMRTLFASFQLSTRQGGSVGTTPKPHALCTKSRAASAPGDQHAALVQLRLCQHRHLLPGIPEWSRAAELRVCPEKGELQGHPRAPSSA